MRRLLGVVWSIALLRSEPRDLPASMRLLALAAAVNFSLELLALRLMPHPEGALNHSLLDLGLTTTVFSALLLLFRRGHRLPQTLTALFAVDTLLMLPILALIAVSYAPFGGGELENLIQACQIAILLWGILVMGHIVRAALEVPLFTGLAVAMSYTAVAIFLARQLMPALPSPAG
jgi:hypothetical protein